MREEYPVSEIAKLLAAFDTLTPDPANPGHRVAFGTSGHRGSSLDGAFNLAHVLAISQAVCDYRRAQGIGGPLFLGRDTHALSEPAFAAVVEVLAANGVTTMVDASRGYTPTPVISHAILSYNRGRTAGLADGIVLTPSHNPPRDGGYKYNGTDGGPSGAAATGWIEARANALLAAGLGGVKRSAAPNASGHIHPHDYIGSYVGDLSAVIDMDAIRSAGVRIGVDPLGGAGLGYWGPIADRYRLDLTVVNPTLDPAFAFMPPDWDGKIRMDCSSPAAMAKLVGMQQDFDIAFANDPDADRHGIVTPSGGLMNPNHFLSAAIAYLFAHRPGWSAAAGVGKTAVTSAMVDRVAAARGRPLVEMPVGFKWFVPGLVSGSLGFAGEESAGASFLRTDGSVWTTDKDGLILGLLAAEMTARNGHNPSVSYAALTAAHGTPFYARIDAPATAVQKACFRTLTAATLGLRELAGDPVVSVTTTASGEPLGGIKVTTANGWFALRPSGTEAVYKVYAESFAGAAHLARIQGEAQAAMAKVFANV